MLIYCYKPISMDNIDVNKRIAEICQDLEYPVKAFARRIGVAQGVMERIFNEEVAPSISVLNKIIRVFPVNRKWLWFGEGEKYEKDIEKYKFSSETNLNKSAVYGDAEKGIRIKYIRSALDYSQARFADALDTTRDVIAQIEAGRNAPASYILEGMYKVFGANIHWVLTGMEEPFINSKASNNLRKQILLEELKKLQ